MLFSIEFHNINIHQEALISWKLLPEGNESTFHKGTLFASSEACNEEVVKHLLLH